jgi:hypothetical protein
MLTPWTVDHETEEPWRPVKVDSAVLPKVGREVQRLVPGIMMQQTHLWRPSLDSVPL